MTILSRLRPTSLRFRLIVASVLVEVALLSVMIANSVRIIDDAADASINAALAQAAPMLNAAAAPYLLQRDYSGLQDFLAATVSEKERELVYVSIADPESAGSRVRAGPSMWPCRHRVPASPAPWPAASTMSKNRSRSPARC